MKVLIFWVIFIFSTSSFSEVLFEAYYHILLDQKPIGFSVSRYEKKSYGFQWTTYSKLHFPGKKPFTEILKSRSNKLLQALSYEDIRKQGQKVFLSQGQFFLKKKKWHFKGFQGRKEGEKKFLSKVFSKPLLLSSFVINSWVEQHKNSSLSTMYEYEVFSERKAKIIKGQLKPTRPFFWIKSSESLSQKLKLTPLGEVLEVKFSVFDLKLQLLSSLDFVKEKLPMRELKKVFKNIPSGHIHSLHLLSREEEDRF